VSPVESTTLDESMLQSEVYYQYSHPLISSSTDTDDISGISTRFDAIAGGATGNRVSTFMRSQYAIADGLDISKVYTNSTSTTLYAGDTIMASIRIKNNTNQVLNTTEYLDTIPKIFSTEKTQKYTVSR
jgi:hypothetical protein